MPPFNIAKKSVKGSFESTRVRQPFVNQTMSSTKSEEVVLTIRNREREKRSPCLMPHFPSHQPHVTPHFPVYQPHDTLHFPAYQPHDTPNAVNLLHEK